MTDLTPIIEDLQALTEASREVDIRLAAATGEPDVRLVFVPDHARSQMMPPAYTASVDAALALAERVGVTASSMTRYPKAWSVVLDDGRFGVVGGHKSLPIAICIAVLKAKEGEDG